ncbi:hypothetical protein Q3G72_017233 [Acer saccharum]|nr:hypothetical protein Q3G72_017233 [Acer saccharum]
MRVALILCDESVLRLLLRLRLVNRTNLLSLSLMPEALEPEIVLGLDLALELDRALRLSEGLVPLGPIPAAVALSGLPRPAHDNANETADKPITGYGEKILTNGRFTTEKEKKLEEYKENPECLNQRINKRNWHLTERALEGEKQSIRGQAHQRGHRSVTPNKQ